MMRSLFLFFFLIPFQVISQDGGKDLLNIVPNPHQRPAIEAGFEWGSLYQERFRNIGAQNFSYLLAYRGGKGSMPNFGIRTMGVHVQLTTARARNHQGIAFIDDPKDGLEGRVDADRIYFDIYPLRFGFFKRDSGRFGLRASVGVSPGIGYNSWKVRPARNSTEFLLNGISLGLALRARLRIMEYFFIEYPFFDLFTFLYRGPSSGELGADQQRIETEPIGLFSWGTVGISVPLR